MSPSVRVRPAKTVSIGSDARIAAFSSEMFAVAALAAKYVGMNDMPSAEYREKAREVLEGRKSLSY